MSLQRGEEGREALAGGLTARLTVYEYVPRRLALNRTFGSAPFQSIQALLHHRHWRMPGMQPSCLVRRGAAGARGSCWQWHGMHDAMACCVVGSCAGVRSGDQHGQSLVLYAL